jgi:hypothetical protein
MAGMRFAVTNVGLRDARRTSDGMRYRLLLHRLGRQQGEREGGSGRCAEESERERVHHVLRQAATGAAG